MTRPTTTTTTRTDTPELIGRRIGRAIARDVIADDMPREWTGLDPQDGDQLTAAGIAPGTAAWDDAETAARREYLRVIAGQRRGE